VCVCGGGRSGRGASLDQICPPRAGETGEGVHKKANLSFSACSPDIKANEQILVCIIFLCSELLAGLLYFRVKLLSRIQLYGSYAHRAYNVSTPPPSLLVGYDVLTAVIVKISVFWNITLGRAPLGWFLIWLRIFYPLPWTWRRHVPPKQWLAFSGLLDTIF
jgi:hypothetical protein